MTKETLARMILEDLREFDLWDSDIEEVLRVALQTLES
jgi:hypothetical protein